MKSFFSRKVELLKLDLFGNVEKRRCCCGEVKGWKVLMLQILFEIKKTVNVLKEVFKTF